MHHQRCFLQSSLAAMHPSPLLPLLLVAVAVASVVGVARADGNIPLNYTCSPTGGYPDDSPYAKNLAELLSTLSPLPPAAAAAAVDNWWFRSCTVGEVSGLAMCYANSDAERCQNCLALSVVQGYVNYNCSQSRNVSFLTADGCVVRYADAPFFGSAAADSAARIVLHSSPWSIEDGAAGMRAARRRLLSQLAGRAGGDALRFATGSRGYVDAGTGKTHVVYGMAQCTRDLLPGECAGCLADHLAAMDGDVSVANSTQASVMGLSCYLTYQVDKPIDIDLAGMPQALSPAPMTAEPPTGSSSSATPSPVVDYGATTTLITALAAAACAITFLNIGVY